MSKQKINRPAKPAPTPPVPNIRGLRAFGYDPSLATGLENYELSEVIIPVRWEPLEPGPIGEYVEVVDVDPASQCVYPPVDLNHPHLLAQDGFAPSEGNPQFHQQMAYAVSMKTIEHFERALGRELYWSDDQWEDAQKERQWTPTPRLRIYPHALREENAYYDSMKKALLFGYFPAHPLTNDEMTGGMVFGCLSHDIIAHETTHAILDGLQPYYLEGCNEDQLGFHEGFADLVALFQHFTYPAVLRQQLAKARGRLDAETLLGKLAVQFGKAIGGRGALRDAIGGVNPETGKWERGVPRPEDIATVTEPHARGALLVAAMFDAFLAIYDSRTRDLLRIASGGTGVLPPGDLHPDLIHRMAEEASKAASHLLNICIRAIDYCPPVDVTFGDFMRAMITADSDIVPEDTRRYRVAIIEAFRRWGIYPRDVRTLSEESLRWSAPSDEHVKFARLMRPSFSSGRLGAIWDQIVNSRVKATRQSKSAASRTLTRMEAYEKMKEFRGKLHHEIENEVRTLCGNGKWGGGKRPDGFNIDFGHVEDCKFEVHQVRPIRRQGPDGDLRLDLLVQITQRRPGYLDANEQAAENRRFKDPVGAVAPSESPDFWYRGGATFILDLESFELRYAITKDIVRNNRLNRQREFLAETTGTSLAELYFGPTEAGLRLAAVHDSM